jgi:hypothetical protein
MVACHYGVMKTGTAEMVEGQEAFERFREAAKKMLSVPKSAITNPFNRGKPKKKRRISRRKGEGATLG